MSQRNLGLDLVQGRPRGIQRSTGHQHSVVFRNLSRETSAIDKVLYLVELRGLLAVRMLRPSWIFVLWALVLWFIWPQQMLAQELPPYSLGYDPTRDPFSDGRAALRLAKATDRKVLIQVGGDWCRWCRALDRFLSQRPALRARLHERFVVLKVNVDESNDNAEFLSAFPPAMGYPHLYVTRNDGSIVHSQDPVEFLENGEYSEQRVLDFLDRWGKGHE